MPIAWLNEAVHCPNADASAQARQHQDQLTKPPGSLGRLEELVVSLAGMQNRAKPRIENAAVVIFAADHGVAEEGVSAFPQAVTGEMIRNFSRGGAAISVLAKQIQSPLSVVNLGTALPIEELPNVLQLNIAAGTANFAKQAAMHQHTCAEALHAGKSVIDSLGAIDVFIAGEMGIANTTSATALAAVLLDMDASALAGAGTGLDATGIAHKATVIDQAIQLHGLNRNSRPLAVLETVGGLEIAAIVGAYLRCAQKGIPVLVDGFICSVAALVADKLQPAIRPWLIFSHQSAEAGHRHILQALDAKPLLDLNMRLGEGSGAAVALPLLKTACLLHNNMATFAQADVSQGQ